MNGILFKAHRNLKVVHLDSPDVVLGAEQMGEEAFLLERFDKLIAHELSDGFGCELERERAGTLCVRLALAAKSGTIHVEKPHKHGRSDNRGDERHHDADAEDLLREVAVGKTETGNDESNLSARNHAGTDSKASKEIESAEKRRNRASCDFGEDGKRGIDCAKVENRLGHECGAVHHHTHHAEENRHEECVDRGERLLNHVLKVGAGKGKTHHVGADDHRKTHIFEETGKNHRKTERESGDRLMRLEELQEPGHLLGRHNADERRTKPHAERLDSNHSDRRPVHTRRCGATGALCRHCSSDHTVSDGQHDETEHIVNHGARHDGHALLGIHLLAFR